MKKLLNTTQLFCFLVCSCLGISTSLAQENKIEADPLIEELVVLKAKMIEKNQLSERYKIQLFYGSDLNEANKVKDKFDTKYYDWPSDIVFETPNYKVWVGDFRDRLEAERAFKKIKEDFKSALIFKP